MQEAKDRICADITRALDELVVSVKEEGARSSMARTIETVKDKLGTSKRYSIGPELDKHIDAIIENSKAVAHVSRDEYREMILRGCGEVKMRQNLIPLFGRTEYNSMIVLGYCPNSIKSQSIILKSRLSEILLLSLLMSRF